MTGRKIGAVDSKTRTQLLDAAEQLIVEEGYPAVTSRRVGRKADVTPQLVHYYFRTMDELFVEVFRRRADAGLARFEQSLRDSPTLRTIWEFSTQGAILDIEFTALAHHNPAIRGELARYAERFHQLQLQAITEVLGADGDVPAEVILLGITGLSQVIAVERSLGVNAGHDKALAFIEQYLDRLEGPKGG
jgi:AcrR family transcriptional regulator